MAAFSVAIDMFSESNKKLGEDHQNTIWALKRIRFLVGNGGNPEDNLQIDIKLYNYCKVKFGNKVNPTLGIIINIAEDLNIMGEYKDAIEVAKYAVERSKESYGKHIKYLKILPRIIV